MSKILYENVIKVKNSLYVRTYNKETKTSTIEEISKPPLPPLYKESKYNSNTELLSIIGKKPLELIKLDKYSDINQLINSSKSSNTPLYGNKSLEQNYIRTNFGEPTSNDHKFHLWSLDIETAVDKEDPEHNKKLDWKPTMNNKNRFDKDFIDRSAKAIITSIQIYDAKRKQYFIFGLNKEWNKRPLKGKHGKLFYFNCETEAILLKKFLEVLRKVNPTIIIGWNSSGYDYPFITNRIIRILDKKDKLYQWSTKNNRWMFDNTLLKGGYVSQLSPIGLIKHKEVNDNKYGLLDIFEWSMYFTEDYQTLYQKYTYTSLTSYSVESVAQHELKLGKVEHGEFTDFGAFYEGDYTKYNFNVNKKEIDYTLLDRIYKKIQSNYTPELELKFKEEAENLFFSYGMKDVDLPYELDNKLKLVDLVKYIAYTCGVSFNEVSGTLKQWNSFVYNEAYKRGFVLPIYNQFNQNDTYFLEKAISMKGISKDRKDFFSRMFNTESYEGLVKGKKTIVHDFPLRQPRFAGGWTRATKRYWKNSFYLDYKALYPSIEMWGNIGIETLILPKDLHPDLLRLKAEFAIFYPQDVNPSNLDQFDMTFIENTIDNKENSEYIRSILVKHNVVMTPNGVFFDKSSRAIISIIIENLLEDRKKYKELMFESRDKQTLLELIINKKEDSDNLKSKYKDFFIEVEDLNIKEKQNKIFELKQLEDMYSTYEQGIKVLVNSQYGSLSMEANMFAGHKEYFSTAITSSARIANHLMSREQSKKIMELTNTVPTEIRYGRLSYLDRISIVDTDSLASSMEPLVIQKYGEDYDTKITKKELLNFILDYVNNTALPLTREVLDNKYGYTLNAYLPGKLIEENELISDCLPYNSLIQTNKGNIEIGSIENNYKEYKVLCMNHRTNKQEYRRIVNFKKNKTTKKILTISNGVDTIKCTEDHKIYTKNRGYIEAKYITKKDILCLNIK